MIIEIKKIKNKKLEMRSNKASLLISKVILKK
jgi:hypothetical protein